MKSPAIQDAAFIWAIHNGVDVADIPSQSDNADDPDWPRYDLPMIPGESKKAFVSRALHEYRRLQTSDSGERLATRSFNQKHVEWLVRFQLNGEGYDHIRITEGISRKRVKQAIKSVAAMIGLELRKPSGGRPRSSRLPKRPSRHIVRRTPNR